MKSLTFLVSLLSTAVLALVQAPTSNINDLELTPKEVVEQLWNMAMRGDLLTTDGWNRSCQYFTKPVSAPGNKVVSVVSNDYGIVRNSVEGKSATVWIGFRKLGQIDSRLRFTPEPPSNAYDSAEEYRLVVGHRHIITYGADGKTKLQDKEIMESIIWQIDGSPGPPWTTVNTAIRYVLEQKAKATNPLVLKNADQTLTKLLALH